jgi:hypothetical protein
MRVQGRRLPHKEERGGYTEEERCRCKENTIRKEERGREQMGSYLYGDEIGYENAGQAAVACTAHLSHSRLKVWQKGFHIKQ